MHQEFRQITEPSVFDQQVFRRGLLQRNNFPLHFLSWTKTPFKWMAFAHSLWPQLAALLPTLVLWSQNRQTEDEGRWRGLTQQVRTWNNCNYYSASFSGTAAWLDGVLADLFIFSLFCFLRCLEPLKLGRLNVWFPSCFYEEEEEEEDSAAGHWLSKDQLSWLSLGESPTSI